MVKATSDRRSSIGPLPYRQPGADLLCTERFKPDGYRAVRDPGTVGNRGTGGDDDRYGAPLIGLALLERLDTQ